MTRPIQAFWLCIFLGICGCRRNYDVNFPLRSSDVSGAWVLSSVPPAVSNQLGGNYTSAKLFLHDDGAAEFSFIPVEQLDRSGPVPVSKWLIVSGRGRWSLMDWGKQDYHTWRVTLETGSQGISLTVGKRRKSELILVYWPDPDEDDRVVFCKPIDPL